MREKISFNQGWLFCAQDRKDMYDPSFDDHDWNRIILPHDWSLEYPLRKEEPSGAGGGYVKTGTGWYRKHFDVADFDENAEYSFLFEGIYMDSVIYLNGEKVGSQGYGYSSFYVDVTGKLLAEGNLMAVRVNNSLQPNSRWYTGSGIYRNVYLERTEKVCFDHFGLRCATNALYPSMGEAALQIRALVRNTSDEDVRVGVVHKLYDTENRLVASSGTALALAPGESGDCMTRPTVSHPHLWTDEDPYLYTLVSSLSLGGRKVDEITTQTGIRTASFDADRGFLLNGNPVKIRGVCLHHDCGLMGAVGPGEVWERRLVKLKDMGANGIRMSHNPPEPALLDLCDRMGFLVMDEIFDEWMLGKNKNENYYSESMAFGSSQFFIRDSEKDLTAMLRRDFNHPSVILWSVGNEIPEQSSADGVKTAKRLVEICHREDSTRMVTLACDNIAAVENIRTDREFEKVPDVTGYNYVGRWRERAETFYDEDRKEFPDRRFIGTENPGADGIRGDYRTSGGSCGSDYRTATMRHEAMWRYVASHDFVAGDYIWSGIDYLGESPWPMRGAVFGPIDTAGFEKDTFYYFRSIWNKKDVTLHLLPHWNFEGEEGKFQTVIAYTDCQYVKLYLNGRLVGTKGYYECPRFGATRSWTDGWEKHPTTNDLHLSWDVPWEKGTLRAEGYVNDELVATCCVETTGRPVRLEAALYKKEQKTGEIAQIELCTRDAEGRFVPDAEPLISCRVTGEAHLVGMDGGDLRDLTPYGSPERRMVAGRLLAAVRCDGPGKVSVDFETEEGLCARVDIQVQNERA